MLDADIKRYQALMLGNAALVIMVGFVGGFMLTFAVLGRIELWPLFSIDYQVPGSVHAWRAAHVGAITNGLLCVMGAVALPFVAVGRARLFVAYGLIFTAWGNCMFYVFSVFGNTRGLSGGYVEGMGQSNMYDVFAYVPAILAATIAIICMVLIALGALKTVLTGNGR
ncbi:MAG: hypothetical protein V7721_00155 [Porticoccaceae bacterium]